MTFIIPQSGELKINNQHNEGFYNEFYYYVDGNSDKMPLKVSYDLKDKSDSNTVMIWAIRAGSSRKLIEEDKYQFTKFKFFIVPDVKRLDSLLRIRY